jgi:tetratricopeptide (TPR) repeat protein
MARRTPRLSRPRGLVPSPFALYGAIIFGTALAVRLAHVWQLRGSPFFTLLIGDARGYHEWAQRIAAGDWIGRDVFYQAPLYPYFLGLTYRIVGEDPATVRVVQAIIGSLGCVLVGLAGARVISRLAGLAAGLVLALYAPAIFLDGLFQKSVLDVFLIAAALWATSWLLAGEDDRANVPGHARAGWWIALGASLGALSLNRENALAIVCVVLAWATIRGLRAARRGVRSRAAMAAPLGLIAGLTLTLGPVVARNAWVGGGWYLTTSQFGPNLYIGNNPRADGTYMALREGRGDPMYEREDATDLAEQSVGRRLTPAEVSAFWRSKALQFVGDEPGQWARLMARKIGLLVSATETIDTEAQESHAEWSAPLTIGGIVGHFGVLLPVAVAGMIVRWRDRSRLAVLYAMMVAYAGSVVLFFVVARYRYPLIPFLALFAGAGLAHSRDWLREASWRRKVALAGVVAVCVLATRWTVGLSANTMRAITETNVGAALHAQRRFDEAADRYRRALAVDAQYAPAFNNLGVTLRALGRLDEAIAAYQRAIEVHPQYWEVHQNLATALVERGRHVEAIAHFRVARQGVRPTAGGHNDFGVALLNAGQRAEALVELRAAVNLLPSSTTALGNLGDALVRDGRPGDAIPHFERAAQLDLFNPARHYDLGNALMEARRPADAERAYAEAIRLAPESAQAHRNRGIALAAERRFEEAIQEFRRALALQPDSADTKRYLEMAIASR